MRRRSNSKIIGNKFQEDFEESIPQELYYERYKDSPVHFRKVHNPADYFINSGMFMLLVENKTTQDRNLPLANIGGEQVWKMLNAVTKVNTFGGFLINFRKFNETYFVFVDDFIHWFYTQRSSNISYEWIKLHGYRLSQKQRVSRWRYGVKGLLDWVKEVKYNGSRV